MPVRTAGQCVGGENLLSCMTCDVPVVQPPTPFATKAEKLAEIMTSACPIPNGSNPPGYVSPTRDQIFKRVQGCSDLIYPETNMTASQTNTMNQLLSSDPALRQKMFERFWYQLPYSDDFELYFGLQNSEAVQLFCWGGNKSLVSGPLQTTEYWQAEGSDQYWQWLFDPAAQARYNAAQVQRKQLQACLDQADNYQKNPPPPIKGSCDYRTFEGLYELGGQAEIQSMLNDGYKVGMEGGNSCRLVTTAPDIGVSQVKIAGYRCQQP